MLVRIWYAGEKSENFLIILQIRLKVTYKDNRFVLLSSINPFYGDLVSAIKEKFNVNAFSVFYLDPMNKSRQIPLTNQFNLNTYLNNEQVKKATALHLFIKT